MHSMKEGLAEIHKLFGEGAGGRGHTFPNFTRLPTGIISLDVTLGGGFPMGAVSIIYGVEGSGKTSLATRLVAQYQRRFPKKAVVWVDVENEHDPDWKKLHGVDLNSLYVLKPTSAEQCSDMAGEAAMASDCGLLIVDSLAAMASYDQLEKTSDKTVVAGAAKPSTTMLKKVSAGIVEHTKAGDHLTVIYINQIRMKIGFVMGNPEILPGPTLQNYQAFLKLRLTGNPVLQEKIAAVPIYSEQIARIKKKKFATVRSEAKWSTILYPHKGLKPLDVNNHRLAENLLEECGFLTKHSKTEWLLHGEVYPTKTAAVEAALADYDETVKDIVNHLQKLYGDPA